MMLGLIVIDTIGSFLCLKDYAKHKIYSVIFEF